MPIIVAIVLAAILAVSEARAQVPRDSETAGSQPTAIEPEQWAVHGQVTNVTQWHPPFRSPYSGENSLAARGRKEETTDVTLFVGRALWSGAQVWLNPEIDQGSGLSNTVGAAGFPSGEAYKIGNNVPYARLPRAFIRQVISLGGEVEPIEAAANQLAGSRGANNLTLTVGKFSVVDIFDTNTYAHDPRADFLNWSVVDGGPVDYAADAWGFTYGAAAEWTQDWWTLRGGVFQLSRMPNGKVIAVDFRQFMLVGEIETRHQWRERPGKIKVLAFLNRARMASYDDAVRIARETGAIPDVALVRRHASRPGVSLNMEQELAADLGFFARIGMNDGAKEAYEFTEINRSFSAGVSIKGQRWGRADDTLGLAGVVNALSRDAREYFSLGGRGILIGDGALGYKPEKVLEAYYSVRLDPHLSVAFDYQYLRNPAHNSDRGPVSLFAFRFHAEF